MAKTAAAQAEAEIIDEYSQQNDELTKDQVAARAGVTIRAVEIWKKKGQLPAQKKRRRTIDPHTGRPVIKQILIFMAEDVDKLLAERNEPAAVNADRPPAQTALAARGETARGDMQMMIMHQLAQAAGLVPSDRKPFIPVADAAAEYELSVAGINQLIADGHLTRFSGPRGRVMVSRRQIESL